MIDHNDLQHFRTSTVRLTVTTSLPIKINLYPDETNSSHYWQRAHQPLRNMKG